jgi:predicted permease
MSALWQDLRYGLRILARNPGFTTVAVISLAVGIGVNTAFFSAFSAALLRELPVRAPHELRVLNWVGPPTQKGRMTGPSMFIMQGRRRRGAFSFPMYCTFRDEGTGFSDIFAFGRTEPLTVIARGRGSRTEGLMVTGSFFKGYGVDALLGRTIGPADDQPGAEPVAVITHRAWTRHFAMDPHVIGDTIILNGDSLTVVGVLPEDYVGPVLGNGADVYMPLSLQPRFVPDFPLASPDNYWLLVMFRLAPGVGAVQAKASLETLWHRHMEGRWDEEYLPAGGPPALLVFDGRHGPVIDREHMGRVLREWMAVGGLLLLIACANLAGLLLARNAVREHEMAVRAALGAGRWRLLRQSLVESLCVSAVGGILGVLLAWWGGGVLASVLPRFFDFPGVLNSPDWTHLTVRLEPVVLLFTLGCVLATALLIGLLPGLLDARIQPGARLQSTRVRGMPRMRIGKALVVVQIALSVILMVGAGLFVRVLVKQWRVGLGFNPKNLLVCHVNAAQAGYEDPKCTQLYEEVHRALGSLPGVRSAGFADQCHIGAGWDWCRVSVPEQSIKDLMVTCMAVSDSFLETLGIPLLLGRGFNDLDRPGAVRTVIVNQAFCREVFAGENAVGRVFRSGEQDCQIVGVCADAHYKSFSSRHGMRSMVYFSYRQRPTPQVWFALRTAVPPQTLMPAVRRAVASLDPQVPLILTTQSQLCDEAIVWERTHASLGVGLASLAIALSCIGVYGLMAYSVAQRTGEIGIRMAIGARPRDVFRTMLRETLLLAGLGIGIGMPLAFAAVRVTRWLRYFGYFGITLYDPAVLGVTLIVLTGVALLAASISARRAAKVDPMVALRHE